MVKASNKIHFIDSTKQIKLAVDVYDNVINIDGVDYVLAYLNQEVRGSRGGNSNVFLLKDIGEDELLREDDLVIKICNISQNKHNSFRQRQRKKRFLREIIALRKALDNDVSGVVKFISSGQIDVSGYIFSFFIMEKASGDLNDYLDVNNELDLQQKLVLCNDIVESFKQIHSIKLYHRDIKHDNILMIEGTCKVGDLGLYRFKDEDNVDQIGERIGAFGWESPETMNKCLTEQKDNNNYQFDCEIDFKSDVFQLGKLFWYIFQGNLPIGQVTQNDFLEGDKDLFDVLIQMLSYNKSSRPNINNLQTILAPIYRKYQVI